MRVSISLTVALVLVVLVSGVSSAKEQTLVASKGVSGNNIIPRLAVNSDTGDVLVVWTSQKPGTTTLTVWSRLFKRKGNGSYAMKPARRLSAADGWNANAQVVYVPWRKQFFVFWDTFNSFNGLQPAKILGRKLNKNGKAVGGIVTIINDNRANNWPMAFVTRDDRAEDGPGEKDRIILVWTAFPTTAADDQAGLRFVHIRNNMKTRGGSALIQKSKIKTSAVNVHPGQPFIINDLDNVPYVNDAAPAFAGGLICYEFGGTTWKTPIYYVDTRQNSAKQAHLFEVTSIRNAAKGRLLLSPRADLSVYASYDDPRNMTSSARILFLERANALNQIVPKYDSSNNANKGKAGGSNDHGYSYGYYSYRYNEWDKYKLRFDYDVRTAGLPDLEIGNWIYTQGNTLRRQMLTVLNNGKLRYGNAETILNHGGNLSWLEARGIDDSNDAAIAWSHDNGDDGQEIRLTIID